LERIEVTNKDEFPQKEFIVSLQVSPGGQLAAAFSWDKSAKL
jgi:hypothetical protein